AAKELVERGKLAGGEGRLHETRAVSKKEAEAFGVRARIARDGEPVGRAGAVTDEDAVEPALFVGPREGPDIFGVDLTAEVCAAQVFAVRARSDHSDELDWHREPPIRRQAAG